MKRLFGPFVPAPGAWGLLVLRLIAGSALMLHGWPKIQNPFGWMNRPDAPSPVPGLFQALAAISEFGGGLAWIVGLLTPLASFGILCTMATAVYMGHLSKGDPFVASPGAKSGSWELAGVYFSIALVLMLLGPGRLALDALLFGKENRSHSVPDS
jgi:putative oxidoreductase